MSSILSLKATGELSKDVIKRLSERRHVEITSTARHLLERSALLESLDAKELQKKKHLAALKAGRDDNRIQYNLFHRLKPKDYKIKIINGDEIPDDERTTANIRKYAAPHDESSLKGELAHLIADQVTPQQFLAMGVRTLAVLAPPIAQCYFSVEATKDAPLVLSALLIKDKEASYYPKARHTWPKGVHFAFPV